MSKLEYHHLIGTEFEPILDHLRNRRRFKSLNKDITNEELERKFPKKKCLIGGCKSTFCFTFNVVEHLNMKHPDYCKRLT